MLIDQTFYWHADYNWQLTITKYTYLVSKESKAVLLARLQSNITIERFEKTFAQWLEIEMQDFSPKGYSVKEKRAR